MIISSSMARHRLEMIPTRVRNGTRGRQGDCSTVMAQEASCAAAELLTGVAEGWRGREGPPSPACGVAHDSLQ